MKKLILFILLFSFSAQAQKKMTNHRKGPISTEKDRLALFEELYTKTIASEAFSPVKEERLGIDTKAEMQACEREIVNAKNPEELFFALKKLSCARYDRHLDIELVEGGLYLEPYETEQAPIRFVADFGDPNDHFVFVGDYGKSFLDGTQIKPGIGDRLIKINGVAYLDYLNEAKAYYPHSTILNLQRRFAYTLSTREATLLPPRFYREKLSLVLERSDSTRYELEIPYQVADEIQWRGLDKAQYPGFKKVMQRESFHIHIPINPNRRVLLLRWIGFKGKLGADIKKLVAYAEENLMLDYDLIIDMTHSRGGSKGATAIQHLSSSEFKTTFGNIRISDLSHQFILNKEKALKDPSKRRTKVDKWLNDWIDQELKAAFASKQEFSNSVPFKCAHAPHDDKGILSPVERHFTGKMVCFFGPWGGSHLDQFASIVSDNNLAYTIGMPTGGYSNTWEAEEIVYFNKSKKPVVKYMWSIGHTIRPNGEILEGNPPDVDEYIPMTQANYLRYYQQLLEHAYDWLNTHN